MGGPLRHAHRRPGQRRHLLACPTGDDFGAAASEWNPGEDARELLAKTVALPLVVPERGAAQILIEGAKAAQLLVLGSRGGGGFAGLLSDTRPSVRAQCQQPRPCLQRHRRRTTRSPLLTAVVRGSPWQTVVSAPVGSLVAPPARRRSAPEQPMRGLKSDLRPHDLSRTRLRAERPARPLRDHRRWGGARPGSGCVRPTRGTSDCSITNFAPGRAPDIANAAAPSRATRVAERLRSLRRRGSN
jgi:hypothetical protein